MGCCNCLAGSAELQVSLTICGNHPMRT